MSSLVLVERDGDVAVLTLNDPERRNAMTEAMGRALAGAVGELARDERLRAVVLAGAGPAFSAGGDLDLIEAKARAGAADPGGPARAANQAFMRGFYGLFLSVRDLPCPSVAAIHGAAIGAGLCVALACDLRVAARDAKLGLNFTRLGIHPGMGATWTLPRLVGAARAAELLFTGRTLDGARAERIGLVNRAVAAGEVRGAALELAREIAAAAPRAVRGAKRSLAGSAGASLGEQLEREAAAQALDYETLDLREGLAAARERRSPRFGGA
jgi:enoyl-CoA hydratase/carnithine racemase